MDVLIEVYKPKSRGKMETSFKSAWRKLERVDQIETLISLERELAAHRKEISSDLYKDSKGKGGCLTLKLISLVPTVAVLIV